MKLYIFDIDGTLTNTTKVDDKCFIRTFERYFEVMVGDIDFTQFRNVTDWGITEELFFQTKNRMISPIEMEKFKAVFIHDLREEAGLDKQQFSEVKGANNFITQLKENQGIAIALATGAWSASAKIKLQNSGIPYEGIPWSNSDEHKSRESITLSAIEKSRVFYNQNFTDITYFGDGLWDYKTCKKLDIPFIGIDCNGNGGLKDLGAIVFEDWTEYFDPKFGE